jgi:hypothetical protein
VTTTSLATLLREMAQDLFSDGYLEFTALAASESTATVVAANELRHGNASDEAYENGWLYLYGGTASGNERQVVDYAPTASATYGTISVHRPCTATPDTTSTCFLYNGGLSPSQLKRHVNSSLHRMRRQRLLALTLVSDGLMEDTGTTAWTASSATLAKTTTAGNVSEGGQALTVTNSGSGGYAASTNINVVPGERLRVEGVARVGNVSGNHLATLAVYDVTNAADTTYDATAARERTRLRFEVTVPAGCYEIQLQLVGYAADTVAHWDEVLVWRTDERQVRLPSDVDRFDQLTDVYARVPLGEEDGRAASVDYRRLTGWHLLPDPTGANPYVLDLARSNWSRDEPLVVDALLPWPELATDSATTACDKDDILVRAKAFAYEQLAKVGEPEARDFYRKQAELLARTWSLRAARQPRPARPVKAPGVVRGRRYG